MPYLTFGIGMSFMKKPFRKLREGAHTSETEDYIDLGTIKFEDESRVLGTGAKAFVRVAEIYRPEDIGDLTNHLYEGNILVVDYDTLASDELALKRVTNELKSVAQDIGGDVAGIGKNLLMCTPGGIKIDRNKIKGTY
ncbi:MAG: cell division protein SepF [Thermoplasmata archaeon]